MEEQMKVFGSMVIAMMTKEIVADLYPTDLWPNLYPTDLSRTSQFLADPFLEDLVHLSRRDVFLNRLLTISSHTRITRYSKEDT
jgi:hypothetical protein